MATLANAKHERFAQELAKGTSQQDAYAIAGYKPDPPHASRLASNGNVVARVAELLSAGAKRAEITIESLLDEASEIQRLASSDKQYSAANAALKLKAELSGHYVQRKEDVTPRRSVREIDARIAQLLDARDQERTARVAGGAGAADQGDQTLPTVPGHGTA